MSTLPSRSTGARLTKSEHEAPCSTYSVYWVTTCTIGSPGLKLRAGLSDWATTVTWSVMVSSGTLPVSSLHEYSAKNVLPGVPVSIPSTGVLCMLPLTVVNSAADTRNISGSGSLSSVHSSGGTNSSAT